MPSAYAHFRFGDQAAQTLPEALQNSIQRFPQLFSVGMHGPDLFYFYQPLFKTRMGNLGDRYHNLTGKEYFQRAVEHWKEAPSEGGTVYLYGVLCHFVLDSICHPMVVKVTAGGAPMHVELETEYDRILLTRDGKTPPHRQYLGSRLKLTWGECDTVAGFFPPATTSVIHRCVHNMALAYRVLSTKHRKLLQTVFKLGREYATQIIMHTRPNRRCAEYIPQLDALYAKALERYPVMAEELAAYIDHGTPLGEDFNANFSGE